MDRFSSVVHTLRVVLLLLSMAAASAGAAKPSAAVIPINMPHDMAPADRMALLSRLIAELNLADSMSVVKMSIVEKALRGLGLKQARNCATVVCWMDAAKAMGVDWIITLSIERGDYGCAVEAELIDGMTGERLIRTERSAGCAPNDLKAICPEIAQGLSMFSEAAQPAPSDSMARMLEIALKETAAKKEPVDTPSPVLATPAAPSPRPIAQPHPNLTADIIVLPLHAPAISPALIPALSGDFCASLALASSLVVKCNAEMADFFEQNKHEGLPDTCGRPACLAEWGKLLGVPKIVAVKISGKGKRYSVSAIMVDALSGETLAEAMEKGEGSVFEANQRMLQSVAAKLAKPQAIEKKSTPEQPLHADSPKLPKDKQTPEQRFRLTLSGSCLFPFSIFEPNAEAKKRAYFDVSFTDSALAIPEWGVEFSGMLKASLRASEHLWMSTHFAYTRTRTKETSLVFREDIANRDMTIHSVAVKASGPAERWFRSRAYENFVDLGVGLDIDFVRTPHLQFGMSLAPQIGFAFVHLSEFDSSFADLDCFLGGVFYSTYHQWRQTTISGNLTSLTLGGLGGLNAEVLITPHFGLRADAAANWKVAPWLVGIFDGASRTDIEMSIGGGYTEHRDSIFVEPREARKGDYLGTGAFVDYVNPGGGQTMPQTNTQVNPWRSFKEYADARVSLGVVIYF